MVMLKNKHDSVLSLAVLNESYARKTVYQRVEALYEEFNADEIMLTSSFAATSAFLLKVFSDVNKDQIIYFIDTGYHFKETIIYKEYLTQLYDLNVEIVQADALEHQMTSVSKMWEHAPNECCNINKVQPLEIIKRDYKIWVSGLMRWQSAFRNDLDFFVEKQNLYKFYPLLDIDYEGRDQFIMEHHLPFHPLKSKGYSSIGCRHCTIPGDGRDGRWNNSPKTECGLHL